MRLSTRAEYGVRAMVGLATIWKEGPVPLNQIAQKEGIPLAYLEQLMGMLRKKGFVKSVRGVKGGYALAVHPQDIRVGDVVWALEGPFVPIDCVELANEAVECCAYKPECTTRAVWVTLRDQVISTLNAITLADLSGRYRGTRAAPGTETLN